MAEPIISVSGLRGVVGRELTPLVAARYAAAHAACSPPGPLVLTRDGRGSGEMLAAAIRSALAAAGRRVLDAGIAATPTTGVLVRQHAAAGGIQISASHNPAAYNGVKLFSAAGRVIDTEAGGRVLSAYRANEFVWAGHDELGDAVSLDDPHSGHLERVLAIVDVDRVRSAGFRVVLDSNHGAGSLLGRRLLETLGCQVTVLGGEADGRFEHPPEPLAENLASVAEEITRSRAAVGFCQDPDADRLALIDERGRYIGEECTLPLCVEQVLSREVGPVVVNCATSRMTADIAARYGAPFSTSKVGEANVVEEMLAAGALFGGEGNGGPIDPRVGYVRDSFVGMALVLEAMAETGKPLSQLADELPQYAIHKTKVELPAEQLDAAVLAVEREFEGATVDRRDGLRLDFDAGWLLIRPSNTEPIVRMIAEAATAEAAAALCERARRAIRAEGEKE